VWCTALPDTAAVSGAFNCTYVNRTATTFFISSQVGVVTGSLSTGAIVPTGCPAGSFCTVGSALPLPCPAGTFQPATRASNCSICSAGFFCPVVRTCAPYNNMTTTMCFSNNSIMGSSTVTTFPRGQWVLSQGATSMTVCPAGYFCPVASPAPLICGVGNFSFPGQNNCTVCPVGAFGNQTGLSSCFQCPAGRWSNTIGATAFTTCQICPDGTWGQIRGMTGCAKCEPGTYGQGTGLTTMTNNCINCALGTYQPLSGQQFCEICPPGQFCSSFSGCSFGRPSNGACYLGCFTDDVSKNLLYGGETVSYSSTSTSSIASCAARTTIFNFRFFALSNPSASLVTCFYDNSYANDPRYTQVADSSCFVTTNSMFAGGSFLNAIYHVTVNVGALFPSNCTIGSFCPGGTGSALACPRGTFSNATMASTCTACPPGWFQGSTGASLCSVCAAGTFQPIFAAQNVSACMACPIGSISSGAVGQTACLVCPAGNYCPFQGQTVSVQCPIGSYCTQALTAPLPCPRGTFNTRVGLSTPLDCEPCPFNTNSSMLNATSSAACIPCSTWPIPTYSFQGATHCFACFAGKYYAGTIGCLDCTEGSYSINYQTTCVTPCPMGWYCPNTAPGTLMYPCPIATFNPNLGRTAPADCLTCPPDTFGTLSNVSSCFTCPTNSLSFAGSTACTSTTWVQLWKLAQSSGQYLVIDDDADGRKTLYRVYVQMFSGQPWVLVLQYFHGANTQPPLRFFHNAFPMNNNAVLGTDDSNSLQTFGHVQAQFLSRFNFDTIRFFGTSNAPSATTIHFSTRDPAGISYITSGKGSFDCPTLQSMSTLYADHTASLPATATTCWSNQGNVALTEIPFGNLGVSQWGVRTYGSKWQVDNNAPNGQFATVHQVFISWQAFECPAQYYCTPTQTLCPAGSYCPYGSAVFTPCAPGYFCGTGSTTARQFSCVPGFYCPAGSSSGNQLQCSAGAYCVANATSAQNQMCVAGYYCLAGATHGTQFDCPVRCIVYFLFIFSQINQFMNVGGRKIFFLPVKFASDLLLLFLLYCCRFGLLLKPQIYAIFCELDRSVIFVRQVRAPAHRVQQAGTCQLQMHSCNAWFVQRELSAPAAASPISWHVRLDIIVLVVTLLAPKVCASQVTSVL
jgi:hypothetical protein